MYVNLRRPPSYITIGLWWNCSNGTRFVRFMGRSFTDPPWWPKKPLLIACYSPLFGRKKTSKNFAGNAFPYKHWQSGRGARVYWISPWKNKCVDKYAFTRQSSGQMAQNRGKVNVVYIRSLYTSVFIWSNVSQLRFDQHTGQLTKHWTTFDRYVSQILAKIWQSL